MICVFYVYNCENNGIVFKIDDNIYTFENVTNNSFLIMDPSILHNIPSWKGRDRYTITFELIKQ